MIENRNIVRSLAGEFVFDDVFMPGEELLDESLLSTKAHYTRGGREETQAFQKKRTVQSDLSHMNQAYGKHVFREFIEPLLQREIDTRNTHCVFYHGHSNEMSLYMDILKELIDIAWFAPTT